MERNGLIFSVLVFDCQSGCISSGIEIASHSHSKHFINKSKTRWKWVSTERDELKTMAPVNHQRQWTVGWVRKSGITLKMSDSPKSSLLVWMSARRNGTLKIEVDRVTAKDWLTRSHQVIINNQHRIRWFVETLSYLYARGSWTKVTHHGLN